MKIGIWGSYDKGNFGDDLMAYMLAMSLKEKGHQPYLYNATKPLSLECGAESIPDIYDFVHKVDQVIIGGGGMLINNSVLRFLARKVAFEFELSFYHLYKALIKYKKTLVPVSIGGSGNSSLNNPYKRLLFQKPVCLGGTVRLKSDLNTVSPELFEYVPDIVLSTSRFFPINNAMKKPRLVFNLKKATGKRLLEAIDNSELKEKFEIFTFCSHLAETQQFGNYELANDSNHFQFENIKSTIDFLSESEAVVSSKLHIGVTGLAMGTPFISYHGPDKAREFLKIYGLSDYILNDPDLVINALGKIEGYPLYKMQPLISDSYRHYQVLNNILDKP